MINNPTPVIYSIVVPVYNSETIIEELVRRITLTMDEIGQVYEIILVDDCSTDMVWKRIINMAATNSHIRGFRLGNNFGQWMATLAGMAQSKGANIITIDDDLEYDPIDIKKLIHRLNSSDCYIVFGLAKEKYILQGKNALLSNIRNKMLNQVWQKFVTDSFKIFKRELVFTQQNQFYPRIHFEAFINFNLHEKFVGYCEVGFQQRSAGTSNHSLTKKIKILIKYGLEYYKYPSMALSILLAFVLLAAMFLEYHFFRGRLNGLLLAVMSFVQVCLSLLILQYAAHVYFSVKKVPEYWIIEQTS